MQAWTRERNAAASQQEQEEGAEVVEENLTNAREICTPDGKRRFKWISKEKAAIPGHVQPMRVSLVLNIPAENETLENEQGMEQPSEADRYEDAVNGSQTEDSDAMYEDPSEPLTEDGMRDDLIDEDLWVEFGGKDPEVDIKTPATNMSSLSEGMSPVISAPNEAAVCMQASDAEKNDAVETFLKPAGLPDDSSLEKSSMLPLVKAEVGRDLVMPWPQSLAAGSAGVVVQGQEADDFNAPLFEQAAFW